jgi:hypothetical protein
MQWKEEMVQEDSIYNNLKTGGWGKQLPTFSQETNILSTSDEN